jgi:D-hexose-6-phosphate mutarotase
MQDRDTIEQLKKFEIPGVVRFDTGGGGLPRTRIETGRSTAEIYLHGAQVTGFQKNGGPPMLFMSRLSHFTADKPIRGGVPICFPWFGPREGGVMHGFARVAEWEVIETEASPEGGATVRLKLPKTAAGAAWPAFRAEFVVTVTDTLAMELIVTNQAADGNLEFENCLHTYFAVGDVREVSITGLKTAHYLDKTDNGTRKRESTDAIRITSETNRVYLDTTSAVEIHDARFDRNIRVEKSGSASTVVWNPWTTQQMSDFGEDEYQQMVCVESGNVGHNKIMLAPGKAARLKVVLSSKAAL